MSSTNSKSAAHLARAKTWLEKESFPLWFSKGWDPAQRNFLESLSFQGEEINAARRAIVQGRQLYCLRAAHRLGLMDRTRVELLIMQGTDSLLQRYSLWNGSFAHSVDSDGAVVSAEADLYTQAFVLFGLANAYAVVPQENWKKRAEQLLDFLQRERRAPGGGFTEIKGGGTLYQSNPHMHLFEAALYWMDVDPSPRWRELAASVADLCATRFVDRTTGVLGEHFDAGWLPIREAGNFVLEPGHHFEWAWLFLVHAGLGGKDRRELAEKLFEIGERIGRLPSGVVIDEAWSDFTPKKATARYWPQCERAKAALRLGKGASADEAMDVLLGYLDTSLKGHCFDVRQPDGSFVKEPPRASFLYHVVNAMEEYIQLRAKLS